MGMLGFALGLISAAAGFAIVVRISLAKNREYAWLACAIGAAVGSAVYLPEGRPAGPLAVALTLLSLAGAKVVAFRIAAERYLDSLVEGVVMERSIALLACQVVEERDGGGGMVAVEGAGVAPDRLAQKNFPGDVWSAATARLESLGSQERADLAGRARQGMAEFSPLIKRFAHVILLKSNFNWLDALFYLFAVSTSYAFGSGFVWR